jgi:hypothetical protein
MGKNPIPQVQSHAGNQANNGGRGGARLPDFISLSGSIAIPTPATGTLFGVTFTGSVDRCGTAYIGFGANVGKSLTLDSVSLTGNWLNQKSKPSAGALNKFLTGQSWNWSAGAVGGYTGQYTRGSGTSTGFGFMLPAQYGVSYSFSTIWKYTHIIW